MSEEPIVLSRVEVQLIDSENNIITNVYRNLEKNEDSINLFKILVEKIMDELIAELENLA